MTKKIFKSIFLVAAIAIMASLLITTGILYKYFIDVQDKHLTDELNLASRAVELEGKDYLYRFNKSDFRLTWISEDGTVIYDTKKDSLKMENHGNREEFKQALKENYGASSRYSSTLLEKTIYRASKLNDGSVLRISSNRATAGVIAAGMVQPTLVVILISLIISGLLAHKLSSRIVDPLNNLDLDHPLENNNYEELSPLLRKINSQHIEIRSQLKMLEDRKNEFNQITSQMREALVLLDDDEKILSMNNSAYSLFKTDSYSIGKSFITIFRNKELREAISPDNKNEYTEMRINIDERIYQFNISKIAKKNIVNNDISLSHNSKGYNKHDISGKDNSVDKYGIVILAFDITEQSNSEKRRREFTANVSHELKTPLQSIIGSAELIENDLVKPEDTKKFTKKIRFEASRLVSLINEIISLAQLDEGISPNRISVNLLDISLEVSRSLEDLAKSKNIGLYVDGENVTLHNAIPTLLKEAIYNLADNAIKYNVDGGKVHINILESNNMAIISVRDTGMGIAKNEQDRIFERFYRSDKSHSRSSKGTGLGLSIVKHAVAYHNGNIKINSDEGKGTEIIISLPNHIENL